MTKRSDAQARAGTIGRREFIRLGAAAGAIALDPRTPSAQGLPRPAIPRPVSIDVHAHWEPDPYFKALSKLRTFTGTRDPRDFDLDQRRKWMDRHGVQMQVLSLDGGMPWQWVTPDAGARLAQIVNDSAIEARAAFPDRFIGVVELPVAHPELAMRELTRVGANPGMRAIHVPNSLAGRDYLFEPAFAPILTRCQELGYPLLLHPLDGEANYYGGRHRIGDSLSLATRLNNTLGFPFESATTAAKFITTGTLDRYPRLQIVLPHSGGSFPYVAGRIEHGFERSHVTLQHPFREYLRRFHYDSLTYNAVTLRFLIDLVGSDRVVVGSDNFAPMDVDFPNALVESLKLPAADRHRILQGNAARLFGL